MRFKRNCFLCVLRGVLCGERKAASAAFAILMVGVLVLAAAVAVLPLPAQAYVSQGGSGDTLGYWRFNTNTDGTPDDSGGRNNYATMHNMELADYVAGKFGYGLDFDGTDDYLSAGTTGFSSSAGTHETWVNFDTWASGNTETIFSAPSEMPDTDTNLVLHMRMNSDWIDQSYTTTGTASETIGATNTRIAQKFVSGSGVTKIGSVDLYQATGGSLVGDITIQGHNSGWNQPSGSVVTHAYCNDKTLNAGSVTHIPLHAISTISAETTYWIVFSRDSGSGTFQGGTTTPNDQCKRYASGSWYLSSVENIYFKAYGQTDDVSGSSNNGKVIGASSTSSGRFGRAGSFDGSNDYVKIPYSSSLDITSNLTLSAWIYLDSVAQSVQGIIEKRAGSASSTQYALYVRNNDEIAFYFYGGTVHQTNGVNLQKEEWYHVVSVFDTYSNNVRIYVNGDQMLSESETHEITSNTNELRIGRGADSGEYLNGKIDEVRIYNHALSADEIRSHYLGGISMHKNSGNNLVFHAGNAVLTTDVSGLSGWHHVSGSYASNDARLWLDGKQVAKDDSVTVTSNLNFDSSCYFANDENDAMEFDGKMDGVRVLNYAKTGFGGGVVVNEVCYAPSEGVEWIELHNHGSGTVDCENWLFEDSDSGHCYEVPAGDNYEIASGNFVVIYLNTTANTDSSIAWYTGNGAGSNNTLNNGDLGTTDSIAVYDLDPDNDAENENSKGKECMVDFAAWGADAGGADDNAVSAGIWTSATYVSNTDKNSIYLKADGNNDEAVSDWAARNESTPGYPVPELPTAILFAVGLVVLVGYVYIGRRKKGR